MSQRLPIALVFPGQASQVVGMGKEFVEAYPAAREVFEQADTILGYSVSKLCFEGPEDQLNDTYYTQPALYTCGIATHRALLSRVPDIQPVSYAGHSLGELTALAAADAFSFAEGLLLVQTRARLMKQAGERSPGAMAALLGLDAPAVSELCQRVTEETRGILVLANDNCPGQSVISGDIPSVERALALAKEAGAKRAIRLAVSIASHSPLMASVSAVFAQALGQVNFKSPSIPVYANVSASPLTTPDSIHHELEMQLTQPVRWTESVQAMAADGAVLFVEVGPKDVLTGLIKRISSAVQTHNLNSVQNLDSLVAQII
jgi:[acyl-carrier-protein] S-malonyltransferase